MVLINKKTRFGLLLGAIMLGAFILVSFNLAEKSLWLDEGITFYNSSGSNVTEVLNKVRDLDLSPPGYYLLQHYWVKIGGAGTATFRFLSVIFGLLSLFLVYVLGKKCFNRETGLWATAMLAINPFFLGFAQEARMYMLLNLLTLLSLYALFKVIFDKRENNKVQLQHWALFSASSIAGLYTHNMYWFVLLALGILWLFFFLFRKKNLKNFLQAFAAFLLVLLAYLPWLPSFLNQLRVERYWIAELDVHALKSFFLSYAGEYEFVLYMWLMLAIVGLIYAIYLHYGRRHNLKFFNSFLFLGGFFTLVVGTSSIYSFTVSPLLKDRYLIFSLPLMSIMAATGIYVLRKKISTLVAILPIATLLFLWQPWKSSMYPLEMNQDFRALANYVESNSAEPVPVIVHSPSAKHVFSFYSKFPLKPFPDSVDLRDYNIEQDDKNSFQNAFKSYEDFWLLITSTHENPQGILREWSSQICPQSDEQNFGPIFLVRYTCLK